MTKSRTLSKKDNISQTDAWKLITHVRQTESGLIIPKELTDHRQHRCGYCGQGFDNRPKGMYFGEIFHAVCCEAMLRGESAN